MLIKWFYCVSKVTIHLFMYLIKVPVELHTHTHVSLHGRILQSKCYLWMIDDREREGLEEGRMIQASLSQVLDGIPDLRGTNRNVL